VQLDLGLNLGCLNVLPRPVLDLLSVPSAAAYSVRRLRTTYTGNAIRVRRSSDSAELDIGFDSNGNLNTSALLTHCGANNGLVVTWYDQSGNGYNLTQAVAINQPQIVNSGAVILQGGRPTISYTGVEVLAAATPTGLLQNVAGGTINTVSNVTNATVQRSSISIANGLGTTRLGQFIDTAGLPLTSARTLDADASVSVTGGSSIVGQSIVNTSIATYSAGTSAQFKNGSADGTATLASSGNTSNTAPTFASVGDTGLIPGVNPFIGTISTVIVFNSALSVTNRQILERNEGVFFNITVA
jgi:hypothetical protein